MPPTTITKSELISLLVDSMDGADAGPDDPVHVRNLNDDRTDGEEMPLGIYQIDTDNVEDGDGYFEIGFFGPVQPEEDEDIETAA